MDNIRLTYEVEGGDLTQAGEASAQVKQTLRKLGFDPDTIRRVSVCMYEGEINMVIHADGGQATVDIGLDAITVTLADHGPGIPDVDLAMQAGYTTAGEAVRDLGFGAGMGLPNMKRNADEFDIQSTVGVGTQILMKFHLKK